MGAILKISDRVDNAIVQQILPFVDGAEGEAAAKAVLAPNPTPGRFHMVQRGDYWYVVGDWDVFMDFAARCEY